MRVRSGAVEIDVEADDAHASREPLLLIMGLAAQMVLWPDGLCDRLRARGFRLIRMDNRDIGRSTHLSHLPVPDGGRALARSVLKLPVHAPYRLEDMADDARAVLDALGIEKAHVVGASMGGMIAQTLAVRNPERFLSLTSIMSAPGGRRALVGVQRAALRSLFRKPPTTREESAASMVRTFQIIGSRTHPVDEALVRSMGEQSFDRGLNPAGVARQFAAILASGSRRDRLKQLRMPALVIHGTQDPLVPAHAGRDTARLIPNARLLELGDMGHDLPTPLWDTIADAIASLARDARAGRG
jgi:pimeloyl-ACP methyl ester carboxylesterase